MKKSIVLVASLLAINLTPVFGQQPATPPTPLFPPSTLPPPSDAQQQIEQQRLQMLHNLANPLASQPPKLTKFDLDFPGGTPAELVSAVEKATGKPLNVIIPNEDASFKLPPLKLHDVTFPQLAETMHQDSVTTIYFPNGYGGYQGAQTGYYFRTMDNSPTDNSVWFFYMQGPPPVQKVCRFYNLAPYLDRGFTVDDITTAIQTGWKMAGLSSPPELDYHKETKLLIAFGEPEQLETIDNVLRTLPGANVSYLSIQDFSKDLDGAKDEIAKLQQKVDQLTKASFASPVSPEEKSGK